MTKASLLEQWSDIAYFANLIEIKPCTLAELSHLLLHSHLFANNSTKVSNAINSVNDVSSYSDSGSMYFLKGCCSAKNNKFSFLSFNLSLF